MSAWTYYQDQVVPSFAVAWSDHTGTLIDFTAASFRVQLVNIQTGDVECDKTSGITGGSTSPNVIVEWAAGDLLVTPGTYRLHLTDVTSGRMYAPGNEPRLLIKETVGLASSTVLPDAYRGDAYSWRLTLPDAALLVGAPGNVLAQIKASPDSATVAATWSATVDGATLVLSLASVTLAPGTYYTDIQIGSTTYLRSTPFRVLQDVSR